MVGVSPGGTGAPREAGSGGAPPRRAPAGPPGRCPARPSCLRSCTGLPRQLLHGECTGIRCNRGLVSVYLRWLSGCHGKLPSLICTELLRKTERGVNTSGRMCLCTHTLASPCSRVIHRRGVQPSENSRCRDTDCVHPGQESHSVPTSR